MSEYTNTQQTTTETKGSGLTLNDLLQLALSNWYWFIVSILLCGGVAFFYLHSTAPTYQRTATILVKDSRKGSGAEVTAFNDILGGIGRRSAENEVHILQSRKLMEHVVEKYDLATTYTTEGSIRTSDIYGRTPLLVKFLTAQPSDFGTFQYKINKAGEVALYEFQNEDGPIGDSDARIKMHVGDTITTPLGNITLVATPYLDQYINKEVKVTKIPQNEATEIYRKRLSCQIADKLASVIAISMTDQVPLRAEHVINGIIDAYNADAIDDKRAISDLTQEFITERLASLSEELNLADSDIATFKQENRLYSPENEVLLGAEEIKQLRKDALSLEANREMAEYILAYIRDVDNPNALIPAATVSMSGASSALATQIGQYNENVLQYDRLRSSSSQSNPIITDLEAQLADVRKAIESSLESHIEGLNLQIEQVNRQQNIADNKMHSSPTKEKELLSKARQQKVKEELYIYLLTKLEENALVGATAESSARVIDHAYGSNKPVSPKGSLIYLIAVVLGFAIPFAIIYIREMLNTTVRSRRDVEEVLTAPFLGDVPKVNGKIHDNIIVKEDGRDAISEAFRMIRTNLNFMSIDNKIKVLMCTSSIPHSGKTFISLNLAATLAASGKRTVVVDIDLRRRTLTKSMGHRNNRRGLTGYLTNNIGSINDIINKSEVSPNLDFVFAGPQPPNPTEMLMSQRMEDFMNELRERYDYVIIDSTPAFAVADAIITDRLVDLTVYVIRQGNLDRRHLPDIEALYREKKFHNLSIVLNAVTYDRRTGGMGYGYDYYKSANEKNPVKRCWNSVCKPFSKK